MRTHRSRYFRMIGAGLFAFSLFLWKATANSAEPVFQESALRSTPQRFMELAPPIKVSIVIGKVVDLEEGEEGSASNLLRKTLENSIEAIEGWQAISSGDVFTKTPGATNLYVSARMERMGVSADSLTVKLTLSVYSYPGKTLMASIPYALTHEGEGIDEEAENSMIRLVAKKVITRLSEHIDQFQ